MSRFDGLRSLGPTARAGLVLIVAGLGLSAGALRFGGAWVAGAASCFGAAGLLAGLHSIVTRRHRTGRVYLPSSNRARDHTGVAAVLYGVAFAVPGAALLGGGLARLAGQWDRAGLWLRAHPGVPITLTGGWIASYGLARVLSRWRYVDAPTEEWQRLPGRVVGVFLTVLGAAVAAVGVLALADPQGLPALLTRLVERGAALLGG